ncbi:MAG: hypothetical protein LJE87_03890 [Deltaproteobacteria bacterium]|jgi:hypothetical protein|nr:hypothetical protein [Deltaproteobacteria bacterium]
MSNQGELYDRVESIVAKLYVLRDSCTGILHTEKSNPNLIWFRGAETLLQEAVDELQKTLGALESGEAAEPAAVEDTEEEVPAESDDEQEESSSEEDE